MKNFQTSFSAGWIDGMVLSWLCQAQGSGGTVTLLLLMSISVTLGKSPHWRGMWPVNRLFAQFTIRDCGGISGNGPVNPGLWPPILNSSRRMLVQVFRSRGKSPSNPPSIIQVLVIAPHACHPAGITPWQSFTYPIPRVSITFGSRAGMSEEVYLGARHQASQSLVRSGAPQVLGSCIIKSAACLAAYSTSKMFPVSRKDVILRTTRLVFTHRVSALTVPIAMGMSKNLISSSMWSHNGKSSGSGKPNSNSGMQQVM
mmetsp:Transcript_14638/g.33310  ORF Transcript_14638/g.33310 Transcript_14638/m.33310 type:complete len:257 (-) Transcript_14638:119-889(-)